MSRGVGDIPKTRIDTSKVTPSVLLGSYRQTLKGSKGMSGIRTAGVPLVKLLRHEYVIRTHPYQYRHK